MIYIINIGCMEAEEHTSHDKVKCLILEIILT